MSLKAFVTINTLLVWNNRNHTSERFMTGVVIVPVHCGFMGSCQTTVQGRAERLDDIHLLSEPSSSQSRL